VRIFRRTKRVNLGKYVAPEPVPPAPIERVIDEGLMIATTAARMSVKNHLIVDAIRDNVDYDASALADVAREELEKLAVQNVEAAREQREARNIHIHRGLADALRALAGDEEAVAAIVEKSREEAWREVSGAVSTVLAARSVDSRDPNYEAEREQRLRDLVSVDLAKLELESLPEY
jgi:hypothetical protein